MLTQSRVESADIEMMMARHVYETNLAGTTQYLVSRG
jgi:hypothetical protein